MVEKDEDGIRIGLVPILDKLDTMKTIICQNTMTVNSLGKISLEVMNKLANVHDNICILKKVVNSSERSRKHDEGVKIQMFKVEGVQPLGIVQIFLIS